MSRIYVVETATRTAGLAVPAESGLRFYASDHAFAALEKRRYARIKDIQADVNRLAASASDTCIVGGNGSRRTRKRSSTR
jgi:hypothetical protein